MRQFKLFPEQGQPLYFEVRIYETRRRMLRALRRNDDFVGRRGDWSGSLAVCRSFETLKLEGRRWRATPRIGVIFFMRRHLGAGLVSHEMAHAAVQWARDVGLSGRSVWAGSGNMEDAPNERFARVVGELNRQFWCARQTRHRGRAGR